MRELKKKVKKTEEFEKIGYNAYHEKTPYYSDGGTYTQTDNLGTYTKDDFVDLSDDILF